MIGQSEKAGWAFGLGLERIAMVLFNIPDIRLFWTEDDRFLSQFSQGQITQFQPYSKYPPCYKDMSFWLPPSTTTAGSAAAGGSGAAAAGGKGRVFHENDYCEIVREVAGDLVENVTLVSSPFATLPYRHDPTLVFTLPLDRRLRSSKDAATEQVLPPQLQEYGPITIERRGQCAAGQGTQACRGRNGHRNQMKLPWVK